MLVIIRGASCWGSFLLPNLKHPSHVCIYVLVDYSCSGTPPGVVSYSYKSLVALNHRYSLFWHAFDIFLILEDHTPRSAMILFWGPLSQIMGREGPQPDLVIEIDPPTTSVIACLFPWAIDFGFPKIWILSPFLIHTHKVPIWEMRRDIGHRVSKEWRSVVPECYPIHLDCII